MDGWNIMAVNKMRDDLISREAAYKAFSDYLNRNFLGEISSQKELRVGEIASIISSVPTAFDKEKVIERLRGERDNRIKNWEENLFWNENRREDGIIKGLSIAIGIVEKGGIE